MGEAPFFSIVIPTKDRPERVRDALYSLTLQDFKDFEVIVSDNFTTASCKDVVDKYSDKLNIKYIKPESFLTMTDNFKFSFLRASGNYKSILEDKMMLYPFCLSYLHRLFSETQADFISYTYDYYFWQKKNLTKYHYNSKLPSFINPLKLVKKLLNFNPFSMLTSSPADNVGHLISGFYSSDLIDRAIKKSGGNLFLPPSPDISAQVFLSLVTKKAIHTGFPLTLVYNSPEFATARVVEKSALLSQKTWEQFDPKRLSWDHMPYSEFKSSFSNSIASSYNYALFCAKSKHVMSVNETNLLFRINENFENQDDKDYEQVKVLEEKIRKLSWSVKFSNMIKVRYGRFFNPDLIFDYFFIHAWPFYKIKRYAILRKHRLQLKVRNFSEGTIEESLLDAEKYYREIGFLDYKIQLKKSCKK